MNRFYSLQLQSRKRTRKIKRTKDILRDDSIEPNYPHCISFDSFEQDIHLLTNDCIAYPTTTMDDDLLSVLTEDRNRCTKTEETFEKFIGLDNCNERAESVMPHYTSEQSKSNFFVTTSGKIVTKVKNYPYLFYDPTHPAMMEILKNHL